MSTHRTAHISEIEQRLIGDDVWRPVRHSLGVTGFGVNVFAAPKAGDQAIEDHTEIEENCGRHEELYYVVSGHAEFTIDGGQAIADPFRRTAELVALLETRARQLR